MNTVLIVSHVGLWLLVSVLLLVVFALARQIGLIERRIVPAGARMGNPGPAIGDRAPELHVTDISGRPVAIGGARQKLTMLVFVSPTCPVCTDLLPAIQSVRKSERRYLDLVLIGLTDDEAAHRAYSHKHKLDEITYVVSQQIVEQYQVASPPYAVIVGADGRVNAKGIVNHLEHLDSLITAARLDQPTIESYRNTIREGADAARLHGATGAEVG